MRLSLALLAAIAPAALAAECSPFELVYGEIDPFTLFSAGIN